MAARFPCSLLLVLSLGASPALAGCQPVQAIVETSPGPTLVFAQPSLLPEADAAAGMDAANATAADPAQDELDAASRAARLDAARGRLFAPEAVAGQAVAAQLPLAPPTESVLAQMGNNPFLLLFPELRQAAAPAWLRPRLRVTYFTQNATFAENTDDPTPSGAGLLQYDLVTLDADAAITSMKYFLLDDSGGYSPGPVLPSYGFPGVGDYWIAPAALAHAEDAASERLLVARMKTTAAGRRYDAVRFQTVGQGARHEAEYVWMFDEASGLLLFHRYQLVDAAGETTQAAQVMLEGLRYLELPWQDAAVPQWVQPGLDLRYEGAYSVQVAGGPAIPLPQTVQVAIEEVHEGWATYRVTTFLYGRATESTTLVEGAAQLYDALWLPRAGLANLARGQVLDTDPYTKVSLRVAEVNARTVTLEETGSLHVNRIVFDRRSGCQTALRVQRQVGLALVTIELALATP